jgi:hypothetical protein
MVPSSWLYATSLALRIVSDDADCLTAVSAYCDHLETFSIFNYHSHAFAFSTRLAFAQSLRNLSLCNVDGLKDNHIEQLSDTEGIRTHLHRIWIGGCPGLHLNAFYRILESLGGITHIQYDLLPSNCDLVTSTTPVEPDVHNR